MSSIYTIANFDLTQQYEVNDIVKNNGEYFYCIAPTVNFAVSNTNFAGYLQLNDIKKPYFLWKPSYNSQSIFRPKIKSIKFGDGYEQRMKANINNNLQEFELTFENRTDSEARAILHFLHTREGKESFFWTPNVPFSETKTFICSQWQETKTFINNHTISAKFVERPFNIVFLPPIIEEVGLSRGLALHWKLDETSGDRAEQIQGETLTDINTVASAAAPPNMGTAALFSATASEHLTANFNSLFLMGNYDTTWAFWFRPSNDLDTECIFSLYNSSNDRTYQMLAQNAEWSNRKGFTWVVVTSDEERAISSDDSFFNLSGYFVLGGWNFMICGYDKFSNSIFAENNANILTFKTESLTDANIKQATTAKFQIGARELTGDRAFVSGRIASLSKWHRLLTLEERLRLYNNGNGLAYPFI